MELLLQIFFIIFLIFCNAFFVASEFALVAIRKTRIDEIAKKGNKKAKSLSAMLSQLDLYISSTQAGITFASLALGWIGEPTVAHLIEPLFYMVPEELVFISLHTVATIIAFILITFLHIVLGEVVPKTIALQKAYPVAFFIVTPLNIFTQVFRPFIWLLDKTSTMILRSFRFSVSAGHYLTHSEEEIKTILSQSGQSGAIEKTEAELVTRALRLDDIPVSMLMTKREEIVAFSSTTSLDELRQLIDKSQVSRVPVYRKSLETIVGYIHMKDVYEALIEGQGTKNIKETAIIRKVTTVQEVEHVYAVLSKMKKENTHLIVVKNNSRKTVGVVTLEDIIESLVGDINDEFESVVKRKNRNT